MGSTAAFADDGIPEPPIVELVDGRGTLPNLRSGRVVSRIRDAEEPLRIRLPDVGDD